MLGIEPNDTTDTQNNTLMPKQHFPFIYKAKTNSSIHCHSNLFSVEKDNLCFDFNNTGTLASSLTLSNRQLYCGVEIE